MKKSVFQFLEEKDRPTKLTIERSTTSKYQFYLAVRDYQQRLMLKPKFVNYLRGEADAVKSLIEEVSLFEPVSLYVLEGFPKVYVQNLKLPREVTCLAETDDGDIRTDGYSLMQKRGILRTLHLQLKIRLTLTALLKLDWSGMEGFEEFESVLRKWKLMNGSQDDLKEELEKRLEGTLLEEMKRGKTKECLMKLDRLGEIRFLNRLQNNLSVLIQYKAMLAVGYDEKRVEQLLNLGWRSAQEYSSLAKLFSPEEVELIARRLVTLDSMIQRYKREGLVMLLTGIAGE